MRFIAPALFVFFLMLLSVSHADHHITFAVGGSKGVFTFWETIIDDYISSKGIPVRIIALPRTTDQKRQPLVVALENRNSDPDVMLIDVAWIAEFAEKGWLHPLDELLDKDTTLSRESFISTLIDTTDTYKGKLVALPTRIDGGLLYYRKDLLKRFDMKPPVTWQELLQQSLIVQNELRPTNPLFHGFVWQGAHYEGLVCNFMEFAGKKGGIRFENNKPTVDTSENLRALEFMLKTISPNGISPANTVQDMKEEEVRKFFEEGNALFQRNWPYAWFRHQKDGSPVQDKVGIAPLPAFVDGENASTLGGWHMAISASSDDKEKAWDFLRFALSHASQVKLALLRGNPPALESAYSDPGLIAAKPVFKDLRIALESTTPRPIVPQYSALSKILQKYLWEALNGKLSSKKALEYAQREMRNAMK